MAKLIYPVILLFVFWLGVSLWNHDGRAQNMHLANAALVEAGSGFTQRMGDPLPLATISSFEGISRQFFSVVIIMMASVVLALRRRRYHGAPRRR